MIQILLDIMVLLVVVWISGNLLGWLVCRQLEGGALPWSWWIFAGPTSYLRRIGEP